MDSPNSYLNPFFPEFYFLLGACYLLIFLFLDSEELLCFSENTKKGLDNANLLLLQIPPFSHNMCARFHISKLSRSLVFLLFVPPFLFFFPFSFSSRFTCVCMYYYSVIYDCFSLRCDIFVFIYPRVSPRFHLSLISSLSLLFLPLSVFPLSFFSIIAPFPLIILFFNIIVVSFVTPSLFRSPRVFSKFSLIFDYIDYLCATIQKKNLPRVESTLRLPWYISTNLSLVCSVVGVWVDYFSDPFGDFYGVLSYCCVHGDNFSWVSLPA